ncbi:MAG: hypothetical protein ACQEWF_00015 [Bacillota bacterium]
MKNKGVIPLMIFVSITLVFILTFSLFVFLGENIRGIIKDGLTDDEPIPIEVI